MFKLRYLKNVASLTLDTDKCIGCKMCLNVCPHQVFTYNEKKAHITDKDLCMECGACAKNCPTQAIFVNSGVGCAAAVINGIINNTAPNCDCSECC